MKFEKCIDCENTYNAKCDYCKKCEFDEAKKDLYNSFKKTKLYKVIIKILDWLENWLESW